MKITRAMDLLLVSEYLRYKAFARHRGGHGIHSPFVFRLVSDVFRNKISSEVVCSIEKTRERLLADTRTIKVTDLGAGSGSMKSSKRKVSDITRYSTVPKKYGMLLSNMAEAFGKPGILEFGTSLGISAMYMAAACPDTEVITMEGCPATSEIAAENFRMTGLDNITLLTGSFDELLPGVLASGSSPGLIFIDGNHRREPVIRYFNQVANISGPESVVIIDDIHSTREMSDAWAEIRGHEKVTLTVDIFRMGMVFFRKGMERYDYIIRH